MHYLCGAYKCGYPLELVTRQLKECGSLQGQIETLLPPHPAEPDRIEFCCRYTVPLASRTPKLFTRQAVRVVVWWPLGKESRCWSRVNSSQASLGTQTSADLGGGLAWYYTFLINSKCRVILIFPPSWSSEVGRWDSTLCAELRKGLSLGMMGKTRGFLVAQEVLLALIILTLVLGLLLL